MKLPASQPPPAIKRTQTVTVPGRVIRITIPVSVPMIEPRPLPPLPS